MGRNSKITERRSMRISVQKYIDQKAVQEHQRRLAQQQHQQNDRHQQRPAEVAAAPQVEPAPSSSSDRDSDWPRLAPASIPRHRPDAEAPGPSRDLRENNEDQEQNPNNGNDRPDDVPRIEPSALVPAPRAEAAAEEVVVREEEPAQQRNPGNDLRKPESRPPIIAQSRNERYHGRDSGRRNFGETYVLELSQRILSDRDEGTVQRLMNAEPLRDFELVSRDGRSFRCHKELLQNMLLCIDISNSWSVPKLDLDASQTTVGKIVDFALSGRITIDDHCIFELMEVADFLGFESLLRVCVAYASRQSFRTKNVAEVHSRFSHVDGVPELFTSKFDRMPIHFYYPKSSPDGSLVSCLSFDQFRKVLASDSLVVTTEDRAVMMIVEWLRSHEVSEEQKQMLLPFIRYPFLTRKMAKSLTDGSLGLPMPKSEDLKNESSSRARTGYDHHVHLLFGERCEEDPGPVNMTVSCVTWSDHFKNSQHKIILKTPHVKGEWEDTQSVDYTDFNGKIYKATLGKDHDEINVDEVDLLRGTATTKFTIPLAEERVVENLDPIFVPGTADLKIVYWDRGRGITSINPSTWEEVPHPPLNRFPVQPMVMKIFKDYAIGHTCRSLVISNPDFFHAVQVALPDTDGDYVDFARFGNFVYLLEDNSRNRVVNRRLVDLVYRVNLVTKELDTTIRLPHFPEPNWQKSYYPSYPKTSLRFFTKGAGLFILVRPDEDMPHRIYSFDIETYACRFVAEVPMAEKIKRLYFRDESVHRRFYTTVPIRLTPCDRITLQDLGEAFKVPDSE